MTHMVEYAKSLGGVLKYHDKVEVVPIVWCCEDFAENSRTGYLFG
jgi:hypothetical protein